MNWDFEVSLDMSKIFREMTMENLIKMLNDKEESRLKKLAEEWEKKQKEAANKNDSQNQGQSGGMGFGGAMGGMGGLGGGISQATGGVMAQ
jgi:hypothetical protein